MSAEDPEDHAEPGQAAQIQASLVSEHPAGTAHSAEGKARSAVPTETELRAQARDAAHTGAGAQQRAVFPVHSTPTLAISGYPTFPSGPGLSLL